MSIRFVNDITATVIATIRMIRTARRGLLGALAVGGTLVACSGDQGVATAPRSPASTLGTIIIAPLNAVIAVGDTLPLTFSARSLTGTAITQFDSVHYFLQNVSDSLRVTLLPTGQVIGRAVSGTNAPVLVDLLVFKDGLVAGDQSIVQVTATKFAGATLSIQPVGSDSAKIAWGSTKRIVPVIKNAGGQSVSNPNVRFEYGPGDSTTLQCYVPTIQAVGVLTRAQLQMSDCGYNANAGTVRLDQIHAFRKGTAWVHARVLVYGVMLHDSVQYTISNTYSGTVAIYPSNFFAGSPPSNIFVAPGARVTFLNGFDPSVGVSIGFTFDHPEVALAGTPPATNGGSSGNVSPITSDQVTSYRIFRTPGVYTWTATIFGGIAPYTGQTSTGTITVE